MDDNLNATAELAPLAERVPCLRRAGGLRWSPNRAGSCH